MTVMATPPSDDTRTLFKMLVDGEWHTYQVIRDALAKTVPPGRALRKYSERYRQNRKGDGGQSPLSEDEQIKFGQSACAQITITSWKGRGIQHRVVEGTKQIRVDPNYQGWGLMLPGGQKGAQNAESAEGSPEVPPADSEPSKPGPVVPDGSSEAQPIPPPAEPATPPAPADPAAKVAAVATTGLLKSAPVVKAVRNSSTGEWVPAVAGSSTSPEPSPSVTRREGRTCPECGLLISDEGRHDSWHQRRAKELERPDMALLDKEAMVTLLGDVMGQELAAFQKGMQGWLMQQFTQLALVMGASQPTPPWLSGNPPKGNHRA